ncbi:MAG: histidine kinase dimerization/phospho-acceptor domain-containing protein [Anaerolineales bacterium]|nr:histidine kinase dimerization/phospho-acceptor domain-containing protein [Anaerolineales bacterium]
MDSDQARRLASFPEMNPNPVLEVDINGKIIYANPAATAFLEGAGLSDPTAYLPGDIVEILRRVAQGEWGVVLREVTLGERVFLESISLNPYYQTARIYCAEITQRKKAELQLHQSLERLRGLRMISRAMLEARSPAEIVRIGLEHLVNLAQCQQAAVLLVQSGSLTAQAHRYHAQQGFSSLAEFALQTEDFEHLQVLSQDGMILHENIHLQEETLAAHWMVWAEGTQTALELPLIAHSELMGVLHLTKSEADPFPADAMEFAVEAAEHLAAALYNARLLEQAQHYASGLEHSVAERTRQLQDALAFRQAILEAAAIGVLVYDQDGQCLMANQTAANIVGASLEQLLAQNYHQLDSWKRSSMYAAALEAVRTFTIQERDLHVITTFGRDVWLRCRFSPFDSNGQFHLLLIIEDITGQMQKQAEIEALNQRLQAQAVRLEQANQELEAFSYSVSHDLRAPLRSLDGFSQALLTRYADQLDEQGRHYLERIRAGAQRMGELINDLLDLSRVGRSEMRRQPVDLSALARQIATELQASEPQRVAVFEIQDDLIVEGDAHLLGLALTNLLENAWKFSRSRRSASIKIGKYQQGRETVFFVQDNGVGFDMTYVNKLFSPFQRLHGMHEFPGTGIGLATVKRILQRHGGRIWAEAKLDQGATFYFVIGGENE